MIADIFFFLRRDEKWKHARKCLNCDSSMNQIMIADIFFFLRRDEKWKHARKCLNCDSSNQIMIADNCDFSEERWEMKACS